MIFFPRRKTANQPGGVREFLSIAYPLVISNVSITLMHFTDRLFLSWSSPEEIAACIPAGTLTWTLLSIFIGISEYTNVFVAQYYGAKDYSSVGRVTWQGSYISWIGGLGCLAFLPLGIQFFDRIGHPADVAAFEKEYFLILFSGGTFIIWKESLSSFYSGRGKTKVVMVVNIVANILNAILDYILIFGWWVFPKMGIRGAALATVLSIFLSCLMFLVLFLLPSNARTYKTRRPGIDFSLIKQMIRYGAPSGIQFFLEVSSFTVFVFIIGRLGKMELAASNIAISISSLAWLPMIGAGMATATLVGQYIGKNNRETAEKSAYSALIIVEFYMLFFALIYLCFPAPLVSLFLEGSHTDIPIDEIQRYGKTILILVAAYQIGDAMNITFSGALRGAGDTAFTMWTNVILAWMFFVPGTWITVSVLKWGLIGAWCWATAYILLLGTIYGLRFRSGVWKSIRIIPHETLAQERIHPF